MFINKWVITDSLQISNQANWHAGYCLSAENALGDVNGLYKHLQQLPQASFSILVNEASNLANITDFEFEKLIRLFFQPCYYLSDQKPIVFLQGNRNALLSACDRLIAKARKQGLHVSMLEIKNSYPDGSDNQFVYQVNSPGVPFHMLLNNWLANRIDNNRVDDIHLLVPEKEHDLSKIMEDIVKSEEALHEAHEFKLANVLYENQKLIGSYKQQLEVKTAAEKDFQFLMTTQKDQVKENVQWYYNEYEILPGWYKKFGHLIKVITGKRTLRSLFSDNVKKYKN